MSDTWIMVIAIGVAAILIFVIPLMTIADRNDDASQMVVQSALTEWGDKIATTGRITRADANEFIEKATGTKSIYTYTMEVKVLDQNLGKKAAQAQHDKSGENASYYVYNSQIEEAWENNNGEYVCPTGGSVTLKAYKTSSSVGEEMHTAFLPTINNNDYQLVAEYTTTIKN